jgi:hypothetical protein
VKLALPDKSGLQEYVQKPEQASMCTPVPDPASAGFFMNKTYILTTGALLIVCNLAVAFILLGTPAEDETPTTTSTELVGTIVATTTPTSEVLQAAGATSKGVVQGRESAPAPRPTDIGEPAVAPMVQEVERAKSASPSGKGPVPIPVLAPGTVLDAMDAYKKVSDTFSYAGKEHPGIGFFVQEIGGVREGEGYYWMLYVNGETADLGASRLRVAPGDTVEWRFQEGY